MEKILNKHGLTREKKGATYEHMTVEEFKLAAAEKNLTATLESSKKWKQEDDVEKIQRENNLLRAEKEKLERQRLSPWKSFFYSSTEKQSFVQTELDKLTIPYRETENGFEAQECYVDEIRKLEKMFKPKESANRTKLRDDVDKFVMQSKDFEEFVSLLEQSGYQVKQGKYISVKPQYGTHSIRLKSLGEDYSEQALRNRIVDKNKYENEIDCRIGTASNSLEVMTYKTVKHYTVVFKSNVLPMRKRQQKKPFAWTNDTELDKLSELNKKINTGVTPESLRNNFMSLEKSIADKENQLGNLKNELKFFTDLFNAGERCYKNGEQNERDLTFLEKNNVTADNYQKIESLIIKSKDEITGIEKSAASEREKLKDVSDTLSMLEKVVGGTYVQSLIDAEKHRRQSEIIPNGLKRPD